MIASPEIFNTVQEPTRVSPCKITAPTRLEIFPSVPADIVVSVSALSAKKV